MARCHAAARLCWEPLLCATHQPFSTCDQGTDEWLPRDCRHGAPCMRADPATASDVQVVCMAAPSSSATARQGVMRSADVCDSRALRQVLSASRCEGPTDAAPQRDEPQPGAPCPAHAGGRHGMRSTWILKSLRTCRLRRALPPRDRSARLLAWKAACVAAWQGLPVQHSPRHATVQHSVSLA